MSIQKVEMTVERIENGQYVEQVAYPYVEYDHVTMENGMDIMSMIRDDVSTPMVTHNTTSWKVGQGDSDVSESIVDSSVASMSIKGQTYQNILPSPTLRNSMTDGNTMQKINEGYDSVEVVDGNVKSAILKGQTMVNLFNNGTYSSKNGADYELLKKGIRVFNNNAGSYQYVQFTVDVKPSTTYTIKTLVTLTSGQHSIYLTDQNDKGITNGNFNGAGSDVNNFFYNNKITTNSDTTKLKIHLYSARAISGVGDVTYNEFMLLEGDYTNVDIPYFEGMQSVKMPVLTTTGKNLFVAREDEYVVNGISVKNENGNIVFGGSSNSYSSFDLITGEKFGGYNPNWKSYYQDKILHRVTGEFTFKASLGKPQGLDVGNGAIHQVCVVYDDDKINSILYDSREGNEVTKTVKFNVESHINGFFVTRWYGGSCEGLYINSPQIEQGISATQYEPYKSNILTVNEDVTLRGIGDVQDTLDCLTGEVTKRIGEVVLDGSEDWILTDMVHSETAVSFYAKKVGVSTRFTNYGSKGKTINDAGFNSENYLDVLQKKYSECGIGINGNYVGITIQNSKLSSVNVSGFRTYLQANPITIQYELAEPIIKTVDLTILDQDNQPVAQLNSFANGYIQVSSQEGTLIPTTEYEVPTSNSYHVDLMKANTQYTMKNMTGTFTLDGTQYNASANGTFTSPSTMTNKFMVTSVTQSQPMLLEGDMTSKEVPYVEGNKSAFEGVDKVEIVSQNADNTLSNTTSFQLSNPLRSLPNDVRDEIVLDRVNHKAKIIQRVGEDLTQLDTPIVTEVNLEGYPYVYKGGHIFLNTEIAPTTEVKYSINQAHQIESSNEDILRHQKEINQLYELISQYVQVQYEAELIDIALQG